MAGFVAEEVDEEGRRLEGVVTLRANDDGIGAHLLLRPEGCRYVYRVVAREDGYMQRMVCTVMKSGEENKWVSGILQVIRQTSCRSGGR